MTRKQDISALFLFYIAFYKTETYLDVQKTGGKCADAAERMTEECIMRLPAGFARAGLRISRMHVRLHVLKEVSASRMLFRMEKVAPLKRGTFSKPLSSRNRTLGSFALCGERPEALPLDSANF